MEQSSSGRDDEGLPLRVGAQHAAPLHHTCLRFVLFVLDVGEQGGGVLFVLPVEHVDLGQRRDHRQLLARLRVAAEVGVDLRELEPGIYLQAEKLGVRIEDDVLVTAKGGEWLSAGAPRATDAIERVMAGRDR